MIRLSLAIAVLVSIAHSAFAGDLLTFKKIEKSEGFFRIYLEPTKLKVDVSEDGTEVKSTVLYDQAKKEATIVDHSKKTYTVLSKESMEKMAAKMGGAMKKMQEAMAKMPPEMRKMLKDKMGGGDSAKSEPIEVKKVGSGEKVGKWSATHYEMVRGKEVLSDTWTVPFKEVGVDKENFEVVKSMADAFADVGKDLKKMMGGMAAAAAPQEQLQGLRKIEGFPVKNARVGKNGKAETGILLESAEKKKLSESELSVPSGYKEKSWGMM